MMHALLRKLAARPRLSTHCVKGGGTGLLGRDRWLAVDCRSALAALESALHGTAQYNACGRVSNAFRWRLEASVAPDCTLAAHADR